MFDYVFKNKKTWITVFLLDLIGSILFLFRSRQFPKKVERILVVRLDHLGDLVMSTPFFTRLRETYPAAEIHLLADSNFAGLFEKDSRFDQVIPVEGHWFSRNSRVKWLSLFSLAVKLRPFNYDLGFDLRGDFRTIFFFLFLPGVKHRVSYGVRGGSFLLNLSPVFPSREHESQKDLNLLSVLENRDFEQTKPGLEPDDEVKKLMAAKLEKMGWNRGKKLIGAHLGAGYPSKQWGLEKFRKVLERILDSGPYQVCLLGKKEEITLPSHFLRQESILNCLGGTSVKELVAITSLCDYFIGNDSGPAHAAAALGVPVLSVFSGTNRFEEFKPLAASGEIIHKDLECSPCEAQICPLRHHNCMNLISEEEVLDGFNRLVKKSESREEALR